MMDFWDEIKEFEQSGKYKINDWTNKIIVIDEINSLGESYHFEIEPEADLNSIPSRPIADEGKTSLLLYMPIVNPDIEKEDKKDDEETA